MKTVIKDLIEKVTGIIENNEKYKSEFHKGFRQAMNMVKDAAEQKLLEDEKKQLIEAYYAGTEQFDNAAYIVRPKTPEDYYSETYGNESEAAAT